MQPWSKRVVEEANLFNPAFCAVLLARASEEFTKKTQQPLPFALAFLVLPVVLHRGTRAALPGSTVTSLLPWVQEHREQLVNFRVGSSHCGRSPAKRSCSALRAKPSQLRVRAGLPLVPADRRLRSEGQASSPMKPATVSTVRVFLVVGWPPLARRQ